MDGWVKLEIPARRPKPPRRFRVATFWYDDVIGKVLCYTREHLADKNAVVFDVEATSGREAKKIAHRLRHEHEAAR